jgi:PDZ domain
VQFSSMRDPVLRRYVKLPDAAGGVFVDAVQRNSPAAKAGILPGDILLAIDGKAIDPDGNYIHPIFGKLSVTHLTTTELYSGQTTNVTVFRNGEQKDIPVELFRQPAESYIIDPYVIDRAVGIPGTFEAIPPGMGRQLGQRGSATICLLRSLPIGAFSGAAQNCFFEPSDTYSRYGWVRTA